MTRNAAPRPRDLVEVIHADALEALSRFPDGMFDAGVSQARMNSSSRPFTELLLTPIENRATSHYGG
jgi:hypothetical protein